MARKTRGSETRPAGLPDVFLVVALVTATAIGGLSVLGCGANLAGATWVGVVFVAGVRLLDKIGGGRE